MKTAKDREEPAGKDIKKKTKSAAKKKEGRISSDAEWFVLYESQR